MSEVIEDELLVEVSPEEEKKKRPTKKEIDDMLTGDVDNIDANRLFSWCRMTDEINRYGQVRISGFYLDSNFLEKCYNLDATMAGYILRLFHLVRPFSSIVRRSKKNSPVTSWSELWEELDCYAQRAGKLKKFMKENRVLRESTFETRSGEVQKCFRFNPFFFRKSGHISKATLLLFKDFIEEDVNVSKYPLRYLQAVGSLEKNQEPI